VTSTRRKGGRFIGWFVVAGSATWACALVFGPLLRPDLDVLTTHPEDYAQGPFALVMRIGYAGAGLAGLGAAIIARRWRGAASVLAIFGLGALLIGVVPPTSSEPGGGAFADRIFPLLQLAPLAFFPAMAWISWRERSRLLLATGAISLLLFLPLLGHPANSGVINRLADLAIAAWLAAFAAVSVARPRALPVQNR